MEVFSLKRNAPHFLVFECPVERGRRTIQVMRTTEMRSEEKYIAPESEVLAIAIEKGVLSQTEPIVDDPEDPM